MSRPGKRLTHYELLNAWRTAHGQTDLCTGPITWNARHDGENVFNLFAKYGWSITMVNSELTELLFEEFNGQMETLVGVLLEQAEEEWTKKTTQNALVVPHSLS